MDSRDENLKGGMHPEKGEPSRNLLSENEFAELMIAEYERHPDTGDHLAAERIWRKIEPSIKRPKSTSLKFGLAALLVASVVAVIYRPEATVPGDVDSLREKGVPGYPVSLEVYLVTADGSLAEADSRELTRGVTLAFKTKITSPHTEKLAVGLIAKLDDNPVRFLTPGQNLSPGDASHVEKDGKIFAYQVSDQEKHLSFCIFAAGSQVELDSMRSNAEELWQGPKSGPCREFSVK